MISRDKTQACDTVEAEAELTRRNCENPCDACVTGLHRCMHQQRRELSRHRGALLVMLLINCSGLLKNPSSAPGQLHECRRLRNRDLPKLDFFNTPVRFSVLRARHRRKAAVSQGASLKNPSHKSKSHKLSTP